MSISSRLMLMTITLQCPRCTHDQKIDDDKVGKEVRCKICHHLFTTPKGEETPIIKLTSTPKGRNEDGIKSGTPTPLTASLKAIHARGN